MGAVVDDRFLERWAASRRREREARRFLALGPPSLASDPDAIVAVRRVFLHHGAPGEAAPRSAEQSPRSGRPPARA